ncbi:MAG: laccase domain-containing protein, partial [Syntrophaceae bacterium]|nr:laccase domain-containing protein [Syntrophaceae bacterium]
FDDTETQRHAFAPGKGEEKWMLDLIAANGLQMQEAGIPPKNIFAANLCTSCRRDIFFSHRGEEGNTGRQLSFIMLR